MSVCYEDILLNMGVSPALKGFKDLQNLCQLREDHPDAKLVGDLYDRCGALVGRSGTAVERTIRHAIASTIDHGNTDRIVSILHQNPDISSGTYDVGRFVQLCVLARRRVNYDDGEA